MSDYSSEDIGTANRAFVFLLDAYLHENCQDPVGEYLRMMVHKRMGARQSNGTATPSQPTLPTQTNGQAALAKPKRAWTPEQRAKTLATRRANREARKAAALDE